MINLNWVKTIGWIVFFAGDWMYWDGLWSASNFTNKGCHTAFGDFVRIMRAAVGAACITIGIYMAYA